MAKKTLDNLIAEKDTFDSDSQALIQSLSFARDELANLNAMRRTAGWKILDERLRDRLQQRILELVKNDAEIQTLLALLTASSTKVLSKTLEEEINKIIPE